MYAGREISILGAFPRGAANPMRRFLFVFACLAALFAASRPDAAAPPAARKSGVGKVIEPFELDDANGKSHAFADYKDKKAIVLVVLGTECPLNNAYAPILVALHEEYSKKDVQFVGINSNVHDAPA